MSNPELDILLNEAFTLIQNQDFLAARTKLADILVNDPNHAEARELIINLADTIAYAEAQRRFPGPNYLEWLRWFHKKLKPRTYVEIGVESGATLQYAEPPTLGVGVDPELRVIHPLNSWSKLYRQPSDDFFAQHDLKIIFNDTPVDFAFIDGLHTFDQALRDFINIERNSRPETVIVAHDIFPVEPFSAFRERITRFWVGDTWKLIPLLIKHRPDLKIFTIPTHPSGLAVITRLNPASEVLTGIVDDLIAEYMQSLDDQVMSAEFLLNPVANDFDAVAIELGLPSNNEAC